MENEDLNPTINTEDFPIKQKEFPAYDEKADIPVKDAQFPKEVNQDTGFTEEEKQKLFGTKQPYVKTFASST